MNSLNPEPNNLACPKHGPAPYLMLVVEGESTKFWCLRCFDEAMARIGVCGMFPATKPVVKSEPVEWPKELLEVE